MYYDDLAYIQHHGFADFTRRVGPAVLAELRQAGVAGGLVVDLGCGDGGWLRMLVQNGYAATGIDQSRSLIRYAAKTAPRATTKVGSVYRTALPRCDAITALGEVFSYCPTRNAPPPPLRPLFRRAYAALRPGGALIFDMLVAGRPMAYETWHAGRSWAVLAAVREDTKRRQLTRTIVTFRKTAGGYRRGNEKHVLRVVSRQAIVKELRQAGFQVRWKAAYGRVRLDGRRLAFVARKPIG